MPCINTGFELSTTYSLLLINNKLPRRSKVHSHNTRKISKESSHFWTSVKMTSFAPDPEEFFFFLGGGEGRQIDQSPDTCRRIRFFLYLHDLNMRSVERNKISPRPIKALNDYTANYLLLKFKRDFRFPDL